MLGFLGLLVACGMLAVPVAVIVLWSRLGRTERELHDLRIGAEQAQALSAQALRQVVELRAQLARVERSAGAGVRTAEEPEARTPIEHDARPLATPIAAARAEAVPPPSPWPKASPVPAAAPIPAMPLIVPHRAPDSEPVGAEAEPESGEPATLGPEIRAEAEAPADREPAAGSALDHTSATGPLDADSHSPAPSAGSRSGDDPKPTTGAAPVLAPNPARPARPALGPGTFDARRRPDPLDTRADEGTRAAFLGGNPIVRVGLALVFLGLTFLLRYASERVHVPLSLRYAAVASAALGLLGLGWRTRKTRPGFGLVVQGGAFAVLYLCVFGAMRLHDQSLLPAPAGFALMIVVVAASVVFAVWQDAVALAVTGAAGGFAAPVLLSTGGGSHQALFSYFLVLDLGILAVAWHKAWRPLHSVGFAGTFGIGLAWGLRSYDADLHYPSAQAFLAAFFLLFLAVSILFARRVVLQGEDTPTGDDLDAWRNWAARPGSTAQRSMDASLLFGTPLATFGLQSGITRHIEYGASFSALVLAAIYLVTAATLLRRDGQRLRPLVEVFVALGTVFVALAVPLAFDATWTAATWALQGAALYHIGARQQRRLRRAFGLLLQAGAAVAWFRALHAGDEVLLDGPRAALTCLAIAALLDAAAVRRHLSKDAPDSEAAPMFDFFGALAVTLLIPTTFGLEGSLRAGALLAACWAAAGVRWSRGALTVVAVLIFAICAGVYPTTLGPSAFTLWSGDLWAGATLVVSAWFLGVLARDNPESFGGDGARLIAVVAHHAALAAAILVAGAALDGPHAAGVVALLGLIARLGPHGLRLPADLPVAWTAQIVAAMILLFAQPWAGFGPGLAPDGTSWFGGPELWSGLVLSGAAFAMGVSQHRGREGHSGRAALVVATAWWVLCWSRHLSWWSVGAGDWAQDVLLVTAGWAAMLVVAGRALAWPSAVGGAALILPAALVGAAVEAAEGTAPWSGTGPLAWGLSLAVVWGLLRVERRILSEAGSQRLLRWTLWSGIATTSLLCRGAADHLVGPAEGWLDLATAIPWALWLAVAPRWSGGPFGWSWPELARAAWTSSVAPVALCWVLLRGSLGSGQSSPLPYVPILNPLDIAVLGLLFLHWRWRRALADLERPRGSGLFVTAAFLSYTGAVARGVHHLAEVPWDLGDLLASRVFQAALSIAWAALALPLTIWAHREKRRGAWTFGASLVGIVVAKLFIVELRDSGSLWRIVSFLGVGVLLLAIGYFAPLPPKDPDQER